MFIHLLFPCLSHINIAIFHYPDSRLSRLLYLPRSWWVQIIKVWLNYSNSITSTTTTIPTAVLQLLKETIVLTVLLLQLKQLSCFINREYLNLCVLRAYKSYSLMSAFHFAVYCALLLWMIVFWSIWRAFSVAFHSKTYLIRVLLA